MSLRPDADPSAADWWDTSWEGGTPAAVGFLVPRGFEAYARILHPASTDDGVPVSWAEVARQCGTTLHPQAQWWRLAGRSDVYAHVGTWPGENPSQGVLEPVGFAALVDVLARHTSTPARSVVAFWVGYGVWSREWSALPTSRGPGRESFLFERALVDVPALCAEAPDGDWWQSPSAWWPEDRAWATSNDTDLDSTLVGGTRALVDDLLASDALEVLPWPVDGSLWSDADTLNQEVTHP